MIGNSEDGNNNNDHVFQEWDDGWSSSQGEARRFIHDNNVSNEMALIYGTAVFAAVILLWCLWPVSRTRRLLDSIPGKKPPWFNILGDAAEFLVRPYHLCYLDWVQRYGPVCKWYLGSSAAVIVADPELIKQVCVRSSASFHDRPPELWLTQAAPLGFTMSRGAYWTTVRGATIPLFHTSRLREFASIIHKQTDDVIKRLRMVPKDEAVQMNELLQEASIDMISESILGVALAKDHPELLRAMMSDLGGMGDIYASTIIRFLFRSTVWRSLVQKISSLIPGTADHARAQRLRFIMDEYKKIAAEGASSSFPSASGDHGADGHEVASEALGDGGQVGENMVNLLMKVRLRYAGGRSLTNEEIVELVKEMIFAGAGTTAPGLSYAIYLLSKNPSTEAKLLEEIDNWYRSSSSRIGRSALSASDAKGTSADRPKPQPGQSPQSGVEACDSERLADGEVSEGLTSGSADSIMHPTYDELSEFPYVEQVILETLRMFPIGPVIVREARKEVSVGEYILPKGVRVHIPVYAVHHDDDIYPSPDEFRPERFDARSEDFRNRHPYAYLPFGAGPRMCPGKSFAMEEMKLILILLYRQFTFRLVESDLNENGELEVTAGLILRFVKGLSVKVQHRSHQSLSVAG